ncbi:hypothetical protein [Pseudomonas sp.]|uniref:hypothetical protein n=1 Tax=Pseudomonas sp. TaxID=306 RepID=UPI003CC5EEAD
MEEWLTAVFRYPDDSIPKEIMRPLKKVRKERQNPAHKVIDNTYDPSLVALQKDVMEGCYLSLGSIRRSIQAHPNAKDVELDDSLDQDNVKYF